ncbi:hypothetical protein [Duganella vulcania]|uniref:Uncharacterized protein n=1 Tax=Duganella vulcania TaxID=2692166 RepID=A0A845GCM8_9BURK|nr:hypothetical protein [Duganella vulcania]MYM92363.1 hypothetical protein [Duganella vulcania]
MKPSSRKVGSYKSTTASETAPYTQAVQAVQQVIAEAVRQDDAVEKATGAPASMIEMIIEETFYLLHEGALYSGMGEEAVSASFAASLAAASQMWPRLWVWPRDGADERVLYQHYSDKEETVLGADFSLIFVDLEHGIPVYRVIVVQAKRLTAQDPTTVNIWRKAFAKKKQESRENRDSDDRGDAAARGGEDETGDWEDAATERLARALADDKPMEADLKREAENYQLTRLLNLRKQVLSTAHAEFVYVVWPAKPNKGEVKTVLFEELTTIAEQFKEEGQKTLRTKENEETGKKRYPVSFRLDGDQSFRDFLLKYTKINSISEAELISILPAIREESTATILLNASGRALSKELEKELRIADKPPYKPSTRNANSRGLNARL